jgi:disease resistance protein RPM1
MAEVAFVAITKIATTLGGKAMDEIKNKLSEKYTNLRELPENLENVRKDLVMMSNVIQDLDSPNLGINVVQGWIDELRKVAFRVEDVMDEHSFHDVQLQEESSLMRFFKTAHYAKAFSDVADKVVEIMKEIQKLKEMQSTWLPVVQFVPKSPVAIDRRVSRLLSGTCSR